MNAESSRTLIDLLRDRAAAQPRERAYTFLDDGERHGQRLTWAQLETRSRAISTAIRRFVEPGDRVLVMFPPSIDFVPAFFAVLNKREQVSVNGETRAERPRVETRKGREISH